MKPNFKCTNKEPVGAKINFYFQDGISYHYVDRESMLAAIERGEFIEHAEFSGILVPMIYHYQQALGTKTTWLVLGSCY